MMERSDPKRILEAPHPVLAELESGLLELRTRGFDSAQLAAMRAALDLPRAAAESAPLAPRSTATGAPAHHGKRARAWWIGGGALLLAALGSYFIVQPKLAAKTTIRASAIRPTPSRPELAPVHAAAATGARERPISDQTNDRATQPTSARSLVPAAAASTAAAKRGRERPKLVPSSRGTLMPRGNAVDDAAAELALLKRAKAHARSDPSRALALTTEHERQFANGVLVQEREVIAIEALLAAAEHDRARARATQFIERFPESAHIRRIRTLLDELAADYDAKQRESAHPFR